MKKINIPKVYWTFITILMLICLILLQHFMGTLALNDRISTGQLIIEIVSLVAILIAIWEFAKGNRKPKLVLWLGLREGNDPTKQISKMVNVHYITSTDKNINEKKVNIYTYNFNLLLENSGNAVARYVKITMSLQDTREPINLGPPKTILVTKIYRPPPDVGTWMHGRHLEPNDTHTWYGHEDFISYTHPPKKIDNLYPHLEDIGFISIKIPVLVGKEHLAKPTLICTVQADNFNMDTQTIEFQINPKKAN